MHRAVNSMRYILHMHNALWWIVIIISVYNSQGGDTITPYHNLPLSAHPATRSPPHWTEIPLAHELNSPQASEVRIKRKDQQDPGRRSIRLKAGIALNSLLPEQKMDSLPSVRVEFLRRPGDVDRLEWSNVRGISSSGGEMIPERKSSGDGRYVAGSRNQLHEYRAGGQAVHINEDNNSSRKGNLAKNVSRVNVLLKDYNSGRAIGISMTYRAQGSHRNGSVVFSSGLLPSLSLHNELFDKPDKNEYSRSYKTFPNPYMLTRSSAATKGRNESDVSPSLNSNRRRLRRRRRQAAAASAIPPVIAAPANANSGTFDYDDPSAGYFAPDPTAQQAGQGAAARANKPPPKKTFGNPYHYQAGESAEEYILRVTTFTNNLRTSLLGGTGYWKEYCQNSPCMNGGTCGPALEGHSFLCTCPIGFGGEVCQFDGSECNVNPCQHGGICTLTSSTIFGMICTCAPEYDGTLCEKDLPEDEGKQGSKNSRWYGGQGDSAIEFIIVLLLMFLVLLCGFSCVVETERKCMWERFKTIMTMGHAADPPTLDFFTVAGRLIRNCSRAFCCCCPYRFEETKIHPLSPVFY